MIGLIENQFFVNFLLFALIYTVFRDYIMDVFNIKINLSFIKPEGNKVLKLMVVSASKYLGQCSTFFSDLSRIFRDSPRCWEP